MIFGDVLENSSLYERDHLRIDRRIVSELGDRFKAGHQLSYYVQNDFHRTLTAVEVLYEEPGLARESINGDLLCSRSIPIGHA